MVKIFSRHWKKIGAALLLSLLVGAAINVRSVISNLYGHAGRGDVFASNALIALGHLGNRDAQLYLGYFYTEKRSTEAAEWYRRAAENGSIEALYSLITAGDKAAFAKLTDLASGGNLEAQKTLGSLYFSDEIYKDEGAAIKWLSLAAERGHIPSMLQLAGGYAYEFALFFGSPKDENRALEWYHRAVASGNEEAMYTLGAHYSSSMFSGAAADPKQAFNWYLKAAERGYVPAQLAVADRYRNGADGIPLDAVKVRLFQKKLAAYNEAYGNEGLARAMRCLQTGLSCQDPHAEENKKGLEELDEAAKDMRRDYAKAMEWYRKAADQENTSAMEDIGTMYLEGLGVSADPIEAMKWYRKTDVKEDRGNGDRLIGDMYSKGKGVPLDSTEAISHYRRAASKGNLLAMIRLADLLVSKAEGVYSKNYEEALRWYRAASARPYGGLISGLASKALGDMYREGKGVTLDYQEAVNWYRKAIQQRNNDAAVELGLMYAKGQGVSKNGAQAVELIKKAASQGNERARAILIDSGLR